MATETVTYPTEYNVRVVLKDGSVILFRPIKKDDAPEWLNFYHRLSSRSKYFRFLRSPPNMSMEDAIRFCTVDYINQFAFVAEAIEGREKHIVAIGRYARLPATPNIAEIAFIILDSYQERGIGTKFIEWLATVARKNDIDTFEAYVLPENTEMMSVFQGYGFHMKQVLENNIYHISFPFNQNERGGEGKRRPGFSGNFEISGAYFKAALRRGHRSFQPDRHHRSACLPIHDTERVQRRGLPDKYQ